MKIKKDIQVFADKLSDTVANFGGSWTAIIGCTTILFFWIVLNTWVCPNPIDPYPYIFLNLILSCIAALQAPFILMAGTRKEIKHIEKIEEDLAVDKKAEEEIRQVLAKLDKMHQDIISIRFQATSKEPAQ